jgi:hypothetical protein
MPRFTLISQGEAVPVELIAPHSGQIMEALQRLGWTSADVQEDGRYIFSIALNPDGIWCLTDRRG